MQRIWYGSIMKWVCLGMSYFYLHWIKIFDLFLWFDLINYSDITMNSMASQITGISIVYSTICSGADQRKHQSSASLTFVRGIPRWQVNSLHKGPAMWKMFPFDDVIKFSQHHTWWLHWCSHASLSVCCCSVCVFWLYEPKWKLNYCYNI